MSQQATREFWFRRLHTLLGVIPVGLFLIEHLFTNSTAMRGAQSYDNAVAFLYNIPFRVFIEYVFIFLPLLYHGVYGMYVAFTSGYNASQYGWFRNWMFVLQRVTGVITFVYVVWHLWTTRFSGNEPSFNMVATIVANPIAFWFMLIGIIAAVFHFANGLWSFCVHWGITVGPRAQRTFAYVMGLVFVVLSVVGVNALFAFTHQV
jgi:succinate dehydrogenase / fumarate reductase cytochrome b subunit